MISIALRTDNPSSELYVVKDGEVVNSIIWPAHRQLLETINHKFDEILSFNNINMADINGLIFYEGPGSFTGLRIGASFINAVAAGLGLPVVPTTGDNWVLDGEKDLLKNSKTKFIEPKYGAPVNITVSKK
ncbi:MAG: hypothetical protein WCJ60_03070 [bacterium]